MTRDRYSALAVLVTCMVASTAYIGAVTQGALYTMVLPLVLVSGTLTSQRHAGPRVAVVSGCVVALGGGEVVNIVSGNYEGSVARSATAGALATVASVTLSRSNRPALFLIPIVGIVAWADALGAGARVQLIAVLAAGMAAIALAMLERDKRRYVVPPSVRGTVLVMVMLILLSAVAAVRFQASHDHRSAASPFRSSLATTIEPPAVLSLTRHPPRSATGKQQAAPSTAEPRQHSRARAAALTVAAKLLASLVALIALVLLFLLARLTWVAVAWRMWRRRLERDVRPAEAGAWLWITSLLERLSEPLPRSLSPDLIGRESGWDFLKPFAAGLAPGIFAAQEIARPEVWAEADAVGRAAWVSTGRLHRVRARWRLPRPSHTAR